MLIRLLNTRLVLRNSTTRIPFRYGKACLTRCPQAILEATVECNGQQAIGYSGDCLPPSWFDKSPEKDFQQQIDEMLSATSLASEICQQEMTQPTSFFPAWMASYQRVQTEGESRKMTPLLASFGLSLTERAVIDAMCRSAELPFARAVRENLFEIEAAEFDARLSERQPVDWLPTAPRTTIFVRHTVGLGDPLTSAEVPVDERLHDGFPQTLEDYIQQTGTRYFKIKVSNQLDRDLDRLTTIAALVEKHRQSDYGVTLDGNEQYRQASEFDELVQAIEASPALSTLWRNTLVVEQPLERSVALSAEHTGGVADLCQRKPVIIDESDGSLDSFARAVEVGYRGVSSKNCKGTMKSLLNAGLVWWLNEHGQRRDYLMTGEDLCTVGVVPVQADLCLVATLGLEHVERNGHHYHPGLSYLPPHQQQAALKAHSDFYIELGGRVAPKISDGQLRIESLVAQPGFGFSVAPDLADYTAADEWEFSSLDS